MEKNTSEIHCEALIKLCRICGCIITGYRKDIELCFDELECAFKNINFKNGIEYGYFCIKRCQL